MSADRSRRTRLQLRPSDTPTRSTLLRAGCNHRPGSFAPAVPRSLVVSCVINRSITAKRIACSARLLVGSTPTADGCERPCCVRLSRERSGTTWSPGLAYLRAVILQIWVDASSEASAELLPDRWMLAHPEPVLSHRVKVSRQKAPRRDRCRAGRSRSMSSRTGGRCRETGLAERREPAHAPAPWEARTLPLTMCFNETMGKFWDIFEVSAGSWFRIGLRHKMGAVRSSNLAGRVYYSIG